MIINITLKPVQNIDDARLNSLEKELNRRVNKSFPSSTVVVKKGSIPKIDIKGFPSDSDRERLGVIFEDVWQDVTWH
ncbi:DinI-like family protein [Enterobacter hormaechei]|uniref:DinI-like family protein n=1 Tax=Enterobacter hormaechei TaxID=158836 RepID=UPI0025C815A1|nr:DinI-like family protein [Enterobacter hormaechei]HED2450038.1 DinI-like family protein [Enterobacter hormaechei subsp. hoffmannii]